MAEYSTQRCAQEWMIETCANHPPTRSLSIYGISSTVEAAVVVTRGGRGRGRVPSVSLFVSTYCSLYNYPLRLNSHCARWVLRWLAGYASRVEDLFVNRTTIAATKERPKPPTHEQNNRIWIYTSPTRPQSESFSAQSFSSPHSLALIATTLFSGSSARSSKREGRR